ncbi:MAG: hypothetical protein CMN30_29890 [Sandaracinus sp.]|nr:hypothetical protein [Sandaracinus sp.]|tara:strand:+ start:191 stop:475 length:285 start_codon:yes stop_codon:yes gene_type:complete
MTDPAEDAAEGAQARAAETKRTWDPERAVETKRTSDPERAVDPERAATGARVLGEHEAGALPAKTVLRLVVIGVPVLVVSWFVLLWLRRALGLG